MNQTCGLRKTTITLLDGKEYTFRALPFNRRTVGIMEGLNSEDQVTTMKALLEAVELSLGFDQTREEVQAALDGGAVPMDALTGKTDLGAEIMGALVLQAGKGSGG